MFSSYQINVPQLDVDVDRLKVKRQGVKLNDVFQTLQVNLGSLYVNDFNRFGRTYRVVAQADAPFRSQVDDILPLKTRNAAGEMVPLGSMISVKESFGPDIVERFNGYSSADINGGPSPGHSSGQAQAAISKILDENLPAGMSYEWTDLAFQQIDAGDAALFVFPLCVLFVFLVLAAQYESFSLPLAIILIVPMALLAGLVGIYLQGGDNNIFTQIGFLVLVGLASKNAILIVEFAKHLRGTGSRSRDRGARSRAPATAPHRDDVHRVRHGCAAAGAGRWRRRRSAPRHGRGGVLRNDRRDRVRPDADSRVLCAAAPQRGPKAALPRAG